MRDHLLLAINGRRYQVDGADALLTLSDFLRKRLRLVGSKIVCSEGDCGACTVLVGRRRHGSNEWLYRPIDSCIALMFQLDGAHVVTVEGLADEGQLNAVQQAMVDCHGSQCGFCTPGFVVQMTALCEEQATLTVDDLRLGLTGNLCRCTGYIPIFAAGQAAADVEEPTIGQRYPTPLGDSASGDADHNGASTESIEMVVDESQRSHRVCCPANLPAALEFLDRHPEATIVAGATDLGVQINKSHQWPLAVLDLNRIDELCTIDVDGRRVIAGARASWSTLMDVFVDRVPEFHRILSRFGSPQIRHAATLGGNLANASPIADALPFLYVMEASVEVARRDAERSVPITSFYRGYKQLDLAPGEMISGVTIPLPDADDRLRLYKVSRRRDLDIASFTAAVRLRVDEGEIVDAKIAFGAVGPTVLRASETEQFLLGRAFDESTFWEAGDVAVAEVTPISDVRGANDYRLQLTRNTLKKFFYQEAKENSALP